MPPAVATQDFSDPGPSADHGVTGLINLFGIEIAGPDVIAGDRRIMSANCMGVNVLLRDLRVAPHEHHQADERDCAHLWMTVVF